MHRVRLTAAQVHHDLVKDRGCLVTRQGDTCSLCKMLGQQAELDLPTTTTTSRKRFQSC